MPKIEIDSEDLSAIFDALCTSMDFASGFLCDEDVQALRRTAELLGVHPDQATPHTFKHYKRSGK